MAEPTFDVKVLDTEAHRTAAIAHLSGSGFVVKPKEEYDKSLNEFIKGISHEDERIKHIADPIVRRERESVETMVKKYFPDAAKKVLDDGKTEPAVSYAERVFTSEIEKLREQAKKGVTNEQLLKEYDEFKVSASTKEKAWAKKIEELNATLLQKDVTFDIGKSIAKREGKFSNDEKLKPIIPSIVESVQRKASELKTSYRELDGKKILVLLEENGSVRMNPKTGNFLTMDDFIEEQLAPVMDVGKVVTGAGTGADGNKVGNVPIPETVKNQQQLQEYMEKTLKLDMLDPKVVAQFNEIVKQRGLKLF